MNFNKILIFFAFFSLYQIQCDNILSPNDVRQKEYEIRITAAKTQTIDQPFIDIYSYANNDETDIEDFAGSYTRLLEHDPITGVLTSSGKENYKKLIEGLKTEQSDLNNIERSLGATLIWANPQGSFAHCLTGCISALMSAGIPPKLESSHAAAELLELYLQAICRDVNFDDYLTGKNSDDNCKGGSLTYDAAKVLLNLQDAYKGPKDPKFLFRTDSYSDKIGPYVSQFLLQPIYVGLDFKNIGAQNFSKKVLSTKRFIPIAQKREFGVSWEDFIALQNGTIPKIYSANDYSRCDVRYPINGRDLGCYVHSDSPYEAYYNALNILLTRGFPLSQAFGYAQKKMKNEGSFATMGPVDIYNMIAEVCCQAIIATWVQKWRVHRRLRPDAMAGLVHQAKITGINKYNLHPSLFIPHNGIDVLQLVSKRNQQQSLKCIDPQQQLTLAQANTYLLAQMYPEGAPTHPSYPAGHAAIAGACTTILKAFFDNNIKLIIKLNPVKVNPFDSKELVALQNEGEDQMTVASELDKLASNISLARGFAGVHYRSDDEAGLLLGEEVAIRYLQDRARLYHEDFSGFILTKRNGQKIKVTATGVENLF